MFEGAIGGKDLCNVEVTSLAEREQFRVLEGSENGNLPVCQSAAGSKKYTQHYNVFNPSCSIWIIKSWLQQIVELKEITKTKCLTFEQDASKN